jgi:3-hydroxymyristoyl/3-hydroxydecanoyl-(acyl carrier protein) dehydratase
MSAPAWQQPLWVAADHPSLPGHFPGQPIVPGVLLLQHVAEALRAWRGQRLVRLVEVKFLRPLLPAQAATLMLSERGGRLRFEICHASVLLARGIVESAVDE